MPAAGAAISNLRGINSDRGGASGLGSLGFLAVRKGDADWRRLLLVSNHHVLKAHGAVAGDAIYQPSFRHLDETIVFDRDPPAIASLIDGGCEGEFSCAYPGEHPASYFVDCAAAELTRPWTRYPGRIAFAGIARALPVDADRWGGMRVAKLGQDTAFTGKLVATDAQVRMHDGRLRPNTLVIRSLPGPNGENPTFAVPGDSGALVVDTRHRAIGLLWGVNLEDPHEAYACHIHPVLACLGVEPCRHLLTTAGGGR
jgi:hypothetical protein